MCRYCGKAAGYKLVNPIGVDGAYYVSYCKNCERGACSEIMRVCNEVAENEDNLEESLDGCYFVYSEDFIRGAIRED